jgi:uncharacterized protein
MMPTRGSRLEGFRERRNDYFASDPHSPLDPVDREGFTGIDFYPERTDLIFELPLDKSGEGIGDRIEITTSDGKVRDFLRAGRIHFEVEGQPATLSVLTDLDLGRLFLPFKDGTSGTETYKDGRYLDPKARPNGDLVVDFNYAYNPWCAFGDGWSCPFPPDENTIDVPIRAGERAFQRRG